MPPTLREAQQAAGTSDTWDCEIFAPFGALLSVTVMRATMQVWKDALTHKQQSPYMRHTLSGGTLRDMHFCPYEVTTPSSLSTHCLAALLPGAPAL